MPTLFLLSSSLAAALLTGSAETAACQAMVYELLAEAA